MKLYEVPEKTWIMVMDEDSNNLKGPPGARDHMIGDVMFFDHLDGMYSYCKDQYGNVHHIRAWAEVILAAKPV